MLVLGSLFSRKDERLVGMCYIILSIDPDRRNTMLSFSGIYNISPEKLITNGYQIHIIWDDAIDCNYWSISGNSKELLEISFNKQTNLIMALYLILVDEVVDNRTNKPIKIYSDAEINYGLPILMYQNIDNTYYVREDKSFSVIIWDNEFEIIFSNEKPITKIINHRTCFYFDENRFLNRVCFENLISSEVEIIRQTFLY